MEIEAKVVLASKGDFEKAVALFAPNGAEECILENYFFDGPHGELEKAGAMCRLRIKSTGSAELTVKSHTEVEQGSACRFLENSIALEVEAARRAIDDPSSLLQACPPIAQAYNITMLKYLGGFKTFRRSVKTSFDGQPVAMKLDEVMFQFGAHYEAEVSCSTLPVQDVLSEVQALLAKNGIKGRVGSQNKFTTFMQGCRESLMAPTSVAP